MRTTALPKLSRLIAPADEFVVADNPKNFPLSLPSRRASNLLRVEETAFLITIKKAFLPIMEKAIAMSEVAIKDNHRCQWDKTVPAKNPTGCHHHQGVGSTQSASEA